MSELVKKDVSLIEGTLSSCGKKVMTCERDNFVGRDLYREAAARYYQVKYEDVTEQQRLHAKRAMYHLAYCGSEMLTPERTIALGIEEMGMTQGLETMI